MLFLVSTLLAAALHQCQPWSSTELAAEEAQVPLQVIFCHCRCPQRVLALQQLPQAGDSPSGFTDPRLAKLSVCPSASVGQCWAGSSRQQLPGPPAARNSWGSAAVTLPALGTLSPLSPCQHPPPEHRQEETKELTPRSF